MIGLDIVELWRTAFRSAQIENSCLCRVICSRDAGETMIAVLLVRTLEKALSDTGSLTPPPQECRC